MGRREGAWGGREVNLPRTFTVIRTGSSSYIMCCIVTSSGGVHERLLKIGNEFSAVASNDVSPFVI